MKQREIQARAQATNQDRRRDAPSFTHCLARPLMAPSMPDVPRSSSSTSTHTTSPSTTHSMDGMEEMSRQLAARIDAREQKRHRTWIKLASLVAIVAFMLALSLLAPSIVAPRLRFQSPSMVPNSQPPSPSSSPRLDTDRVGFGVGGGGLKSSSGGGRSSRHGLRRDSRHRPMRLHRVRRMQHRRPHRLPPLLLLHHGALALAGHHLVRTFESRSACSCRERDPRRHHHDVERSGSSTSITRCRSRSSIRSRLLSRD